MRKEYKNGYFDIIANKAEKSASIYIYGDIGESWFGGISAIDFANEVKDLGKVDTIDLYINSYGGDVFEGIPMYNVLRRNPAIVNVEIDGVAASIASVVAMVGDTIKIPDNGMMMVHDVWGFVIGNARELRKAADDFEEINQTIIKTFENRTGLKRQEIIDLMEAETWMGAEQAQELGFADEIIEGKKVAAYARPSKKIFDKFKNAPDSIKDQPEQSGSDGFLQLVIGKEIETPMRDKWAKRFKNRKHH